MHLDQPAGSDVLPEAVLPPAGAAYWRFYDRVAAAQLAGWLPAEPSLVLDLCGRPGTTAQLVSAGHRPLRASATPVQVPAGAWTVRADTHRLPWLRDGSVGAVVAEARGLSLFLAAELTVEELLRVLVPGGPLLLVADSQLLGLARLAEQQRWAELADAPAADVVLVPEPDGALFRCFWPEQLEELLAGAGFAVEWVRPRTVLAPAAVERALQRGGPEVLDTLVRTELSLAASRQGSSAGLHLVVSARRPA